MHGISPFFTLLLRLLQILDHDSNHARSEPFRTYEALDHAARDLAGSLQVTRDAVAGAGCEQHYTATRLHGDCEALHRAMYTELQQLILGPQVCPTAITDQELLCPNAQVGLFPFTHGPLGLPQIVPFRSIHHVSQLNFK